MPGGFGPRGTEGKVAAARWARENRIPYLGLCYGLHMAVIDVARNVLGLSGANSTEIDPHTPYPVIDLMPDQKGVDMGGTMRLGLWPCRLKPGTKTAAAYGVPEVSERHRHRFEVNNSFRRRLAEAGFIVSGASPDGQLAEIMELEDHPFFVGVQFHPEFRSRPTNAAPALPRLHRRRQGDAAGREPARAAAQRRYGHRRGGRSAARGPRARRHARVDRSRPTLSSALTTCHFELARNLVFSRTFVKEDRDPSFLL